MNASRPRTLLTIGDPHGVGAELAIKTVAELAGGPVPSPVLVGDRFVIEPHADRAGLWIRETDGSHAPEHGVLDLIPVNGLAATEFRPGQMSAAAGEATVRYLSAAVDALRSGAARAIVACPHSETTINAAGIPFSGYPGLLARLTGVPHDRVFLLLIGGGLRISHATLHERLPDALARLTPELVEATVLSTAEAVRSLGVRSPRIGVFGVNPHAGEGGLFGDDDERVTVPAVARARRAGVDVEGPVGADLLLADRSIDAFVALYHDQGHIPVKLLAGRNASALSIGAGLLFSSVGHGAAFDIAGKNVAEPTAVVRAVRLVGGAASPVAASGAREVEV